MMSRDGRYGSSGGGKGGEKRDGDWNCPKCGDHQFASRSECRKCGTSKPSGSASTSRGFSLGDVARIEGGGHVLGSSAGPATSWETASRVEMVSALYGALEDPAAPKLRSRQMRRFAVLIGMPDGSDAEWEGEWKELCGAMGWSADVGVDPIDFTKFVNDEQSGGHCTDDVLRSMLKELKVPPAGASTSAAPCRGRRRSRSR